MEKNSDYLSKNRLCNEWYLFFIILWVTSITNKGNKSAVVKERIHSPTSHLIPKAFVACHSLHVLMAPFHSGPFFRMLNLDFLILSWLCTSFNLLYLLIRLYLQYVYLILLFLFNSNILIWLRIRLFLWSIFLGLLLRLFPWWLMNFFVSATNIFIFLEEKSTVFKLFDD